MRAVRQQSLALSHPADAAFQAVLGVAQNDKSARILAVHTEGRRLLFRERSKMSNPKFHTIMVVENGDGAEVRTAVGTDPRSPKALLDGRANDKSLNKFLERVQGALDGSAPAPATPVANHYVAKKTEVPWEDPTQDPEIELDGNFLAMYGL